MSFKIGEPYNLYEMIQKAETGDAEAMFGGDIISSQGGALMGRISRTDDNLFAMPRGAYLRNKVYVYINTSNKYVSPSEKKVKGTRGYTGHDSVCIGVIQDPEKPANRKFYANSRYKCPFALGMSCRNHLHSSCTPV